MNEEKKFKIYGELELGNFERKLYKMDRNRKYSVYFDPENVNFIVFNPHDDCTIESVCDGIRDEAYNYLINVLNNEANIVVNWSQVSGTTSDYTIYYDFKDFEIIPTYKEFMKLFKDQFISPLFYKYTEVIFGNYEKIECF